MRQHDPINGSAGSEFASRLIFSGTNEVIYQTSETEKFTQKFKVKATVGKGKLLAQFVNRSTTNNASLNDGNVVVTGDLKYSGQYANLKFAYSLAQKTKVVTTGYHGSFTDDPVDINLPLWRPQAGNAAVDMDWTRYSILTRKELRGDAELIYQPTRRYRLSLLAGYFSKERQDYPFMDGNDKTNKITLQASVNYQPTANFSGNLRYKLESIDNPFAPYNHMFERDGAGVVNPMPGTPAVYYYQRDQLRYGDITNQPTLAHNIKFDVTVKPNEKMSLKAGINARIASNSDEEQLDFHQKMVQPNLTINLYPSETFMLFGNYSMILQEQNFLASVAMMDG